MANPALGMWKTEPDKKGQVAHVRVHECDEALCGRIKSVYNSDGERINHPNVGKRVFWNMTPDGPRKYQGRAYVPAHGREYGGRIELRDGRMIVKGCLGPFCMSQTWTRIN